MIILILLLALLLVMLIRTLLCRGRKLTPAQPVPESESYALQLQKMIQCKTVSVKGSYDDTEFEKLRNVVEELFPLVHKHCERMIFGDDCWIYKLPGADESRNIMLMSHHDVVSAQGEWLHDPFGGEIAEGKIWGRGTLDTKTPLFGELAALEKLLAEGYRPQCNLYIGSSCNEEITGDGIPLALEYFKKQGIRFELVLDEGGSIVDAPLGGMKCDQFAMIAIHEKGRNKVTFTADNGTSHTALTAGVEDTATERMAAFITDFKKRNRFIRRLHPEVRAMLEHFAPYAKFPLRFVFANLWCLAPIVALVMPLISPAADSMLGTTCAFNDILADMGGGRCTARIRLRCVKEQDLEKDVKKLRRLARKHNIEMVDGQEYEFHGPADITQPGYKTVVRCIEEVFPDVPAAPFILSAGTDARWLTEICPCVLRFAPIRINKEQMATIHSENENIDVASIGECVKFYDHLMKMYQA